MKLVFLGTRGYIDSRTRRHRMHSSLAVEYYGTRVVIDCGEDWLGKVDDMDAKAIFITHAHPDHSWGLRGGAPCPVYATEEAWEGMRGFDIKDRSIVENREPVPVGRMTLEAFSVLHSTRSPAVGYRVTGGKASFFYVPDVVYIPERREAFAGIRLYIGDGATVARSMVRKSGDVLIGHTPVRTQLGWCRKEGVPRAVFTHCGEAIVGADSKAVEREISDLGAAKGVEAAVAHDGMGLVLK